MLLYGRNTFFLISLGKKKPRWDYSADASAAKLVIFTELSTLLGITFWIFIIGIVARSLVVR